MTDHTTPMFDDMDDIELIVTYLQGRLPAERAAAPAPAPTRARWSIGRLFEIGFWSVMIYVILLSLGAVLWFEVIKPTYFPDPTDGWVAPSRVGAPSTSPR